MKSFFNRNKPNKMFNYCANKYQSIKSEYMNRTPKGKWLFILNMAIITHRITGVHVLDLNFKLQWYSYLSLVGAIDCVSSFIYTIWYYSDQPLKGLVFFAMSGIFIPVFIETTFLSHFFAHIKYVFSQMIFLNSH